MVAGRINRERPANPVDRHTPLRNVMGPRMMGLCFPLVAVCGSRDLNSVSAATGYSALHAQVHTAVITALDEVRTNHISTNDLDGPFHAALPIHRAAVLGDYIEVDRLLRAGGTPNDKDQNDDMGVLHYAVHSQHDTLVDMLLRRGASVDIQTAEGMTPLMIASQMGSHMVTRLLETGAFVGFESSEEGYSALLADAQAGSAVVAQLLLDAGASTEAARFDNATALQIACAQNHSEVALALIKHGASPHVTIDSGDFPLLLAAAWGMTAVVDALLQAGADPNQLDSMGKTALMAGVNTCVDLAVVRTLFDAGTDPSLVSREMPMSAFQVAKAMARSPKRNSCHSAAAELLRPDRNQRGSARKRQAESQDVGTLLVVGTLLLAVVTLLLMTAYKDQLSAYLSGAGSSQGAEAANARTNRGRGRSGRGRGRSCGRGRDGAGIALAPAPAPAPAAARSRTDQPPWWLELEDFHEELNNAAQMERQAFLDTAFSGEIMRNPAMLMSGPPGNREPLNTYEHDQIVKWFALGKNTDPNTNARVDPAQRELVRDPRLQREIREWCEGKVRVWREELATQPKSRHVARDAVRVVHVFVDHSNATLGAARAGKQCDAAALAQHVERGREAQERIVIGSHQGECARTDWEQLGYAVVTDPRRGRERFVDEALHAQLMRTASRRFDPPRVIALVTGDGNLNEGRTNFPECIEAALKNDWHVELHSWRKSTNKTYLDMAKQYQEHFCVCYLDEM